MIVTVDKLKKGDEFLCASAQNGGLMWYRVVRDPKLKFKKDVNGVKVPAVHYKTGIQFYSSVLCSCNATHHTKFVPAAQTYNRKDITYEWRTYECTPEGHNFEKYVNLNSKNLWLIEK